MDAAGIERLINIYGIAFYVSIGVMGLGILIAVISFFRYDIRLIYRLRSGKEQRETVARLQEKNMMTGKLRDDLDLDFSTGQLSGEVTTGETGKTADQGKTGRTGRTGRFGRTGRTARGSTGRTRKSGHSGETGVFRENDPISMPKAQNAVVQLAQESAETDVLGVEEMTAQLAESLSEERNQAYEYANNDRKTAAGAGDVRTWNSSFRFTITENIMVIHTDETIADSRTE